MVRISNNSEKVKERLKIVGLVLLLPVVIYISYVTDYAYRKAIVKDAIEESKQGDMAEAPILEQGVRSYLDSK